MSKKKNKKKIDQPEDVLELVKHLRKENEQLRARLEKIAELAGDLPEASEGEVAADHLVVTDTL